MQALVTAPEATATIATISIPQPAAGHVRVRVKSVALNPVDAIYVAHPNPPAGRTIGSDFAGIVESVGEGVHTLQVGEHVAGFLHGACQENILPGAFAEFLVVDADLVYKIPQNIGFDEAATIPLCLLTATNGLFRVLDLLKPWDVSGEESPPAQRPALFVYSGATSVGCYTIQLAKLSPTKPLIITTASPSNESYLKSLGADYVLDYHSDTWAEEARNLATNEGAVINAAVDCISEDSTVENVSRVFQAPGKIACVRGPQAWSHDNIKKEAEAEYMSVWTLLGKEFWYSGGKHFPVQPTHRALAAEVYAYISAANPASPLACGELKPNKVRLMKGGLKNIPEAFPLLGVGKVIERTEVKGMRPLRAEKLVYQVS